MAATAPDTDTKDPVADIDALYQPTHDEQARQDFVSVLRNHARATMRDEMERRYLAHVAPEFERQSQPTAATKEFPVRSDGTMEGEILGPLGSSAL